MEEQAIAEQQKTEKKRAKKMRGKMKASHREMGSVRAQHEAIQDKNKLAYLKDHKKVKAEHEKME
jgi:hypothetical protein